MRYIDPKASSLTQHTREALIRSNTEFHRLNGNSLMVAVARASVTDQAESYVMRRFESEQEVSEDDLPGCSLLNYGVALQLVVDDRIFDMQAAMSGDDWTQYQEMGRYYCHTDPLLPEIRVKISELRDANSGASWLWMQEMEKYYSALAILENTIPDKRQELASNKDRLARLQEVYAAEAAAVGTAIGASYEAYFQLVVALLRVEMAIDDHNLAGDQLQTEQAALQNAINQYNNLVDAHNTQVQQWDTDWAAFEADVAEFNAWIIEYNNLVPIMNGNPTAAQRARFDELVDLIAERGPTLGPREVALLERYDQLLEEERLMNQENARIEAWRTELEEKVRIWNEQMSQLEQEKAFLQSQITDLGQLTDEVMSALMALVHMKLQLEQMEREIAAEEQQIDQDESSATRSANEAADNARIHLQAIEKTVADFIEQHPEAYQYTVMDEYQPAADRLREKLDDMDKVPPEILKDLIDGTGRPPRPPRLIDKFKGKITQLPGKVPPVRPIDPSRLKIRVRHNRNPLFERLVRKTKVPAGVVLPFWHHDVRPVVPAPSVPGSDVGSVPHPVHG